MFVSGGTLRDLISDEVRDVFNATLTPLWTEAWHLGYAAAKSLVTGQPADFTAKDDSGALQGFIGTEGEHWLQQVARTGLGNNSARSEIDRPQRGQPGPSTLRRSSATGTTGSPTSTCCCRRTPATSARTPPRTGTSRSTRRSPAAA